MEIPYSNSKNVVLFWCCLDRDQDMLNKITEVAALEEELIVSDLNYLHIDWMRASSGTDECNKLLLPGKS